MAILITDATDPRLDLYRNLRDRALRHRQDVDGGVFIAEGRFVVERLFSTKLDIVSALVLPEHRRDLERLTATRDIPLFVATTEVLNTIAGYNVHRGILACAARPPRSTIESVVHGAHRLVVCENITDTENLGSIFRSAAALGIDGVVLDAHSADPYYRRVVRVSMGESMVLPHARVPTIPELLTTLGSMAWMTVALTPGRDAAVLRDIRPSDRTAIVLGAEGPGLADDTMAAATVRARIVMHRDVDSLNVATAAAIALYEITKGH